MVIFLGMSAVVGEAYQGRKATLPWDVEEVETARNSERERESKKKEGDRKQTGSKSPQAMLMDA